MRIVCSYCRKALGEKAPFDTDVVTHGVCEACSEELSRQIQGLTLDDYLERLPCPTVVVDADNRIIAANRAMTERLGQPGRELRGLLAGSAMECAHARLPEGCGKTVHCSTCTIRRNVQHTFATRESLHDVPAYVQRLGERRLPLRISTLSLGFGVVVVFEEVDGEP